MGKWLRARLGERSTAQGAVLVTAVLGMYLGPVQADIVVQSALALWGVYEAMRSEEFSQ